MPVSLQNFMLDLIHESHLGMEKSKSRARQLLYWVRMTHGIEDVINCVECCEYKKVQLKEPMISHAIPPERFFKVGIDIMTYRNSDYQRWSPRGRPWPRGHILKSLALASKVKFLASRPQVLENWPVLGSRTALFFEF